VTSVVGCDQFTLVLTVVGQVFGVGYNQYGQLGLGTTTPQSQLYPMLIPSLSNIEGIGCGYYHSFFWNSSGIYASGNNGVCFSLYIFVFIFLIFSLFLLGRPIV